jgi:hypothetical protein
MKENINKRKNKKNLKDKVKMVKSISIFAMKIVIDALINLKDKLKFVE